jgi:hypothetical protein
LLGVPPVLTFAIHIDNSIPISGGYSITSRDDKEGDKINEIESDLNFQNKRRMTHVVAGDITINAQFCMPKYYQLALFNYSSFELVIN